MTSLCVKPRKREKKVFKRSLNKPIETGCKVSSIQQKLSSEVKSSLAREEKKKTASDTKESHKTTQNAKNIINVNKRISICSRMGIRDVQHNCERIGTKMKHPNEAARTRRLN